MIAMPYDDRHKAAELPHNVIIEGRRRISVSGVDDVESFDEGEIVMGTSQGVLVLQGKELRIEKLSLDSGDVSVEGVIDRLEYEDDVHTSGGFFSRLFK
jgi:sporulation protein YabP